MSERDDPRSPRDAGEEDFLFHLHRGAELLQDNRVHAAKAELEQALSVQPSDPKGQDLLGIVYFRLGLYPRAIAIYERLIQSHPEAIEPRINLALSYLKTGQPVQARGELEKVLEQNPRHQRAWGYLGLAFQRLGDYERASHAFAAGGHDAMARRLVEMSAATATDPLLRETVRPTPPEAEVRYSAAPAPPTLDRTGPRHRDSELPRIPTGTWAAIETSPPSEPRKASSLHQALQEAQPPASMPPSGQVAPVRPPDSPVAFARERLLVFPRSLTVAQHPAGVVLVQAPKGFAARLDGVLSLTAAPGTPTRALPRHARGRTRTSEDDLLGGATTPVHEIGGRCEIVLVPPAGSRLHALSLADEPLYLREDAVLGFELSVAYENGRLPTGDGEAIPMVQLRGRGALVAALPERTSTIEIVAGRTTLVRAATVVGWLGRVVPSASPPSETPGGLRGFVVFAGEGMVIVDGR